MVKFDKTSLKGPNTGVIEVKTTHHLGLHPMYLNDFSKSIKDLLNEGIAKYNRNLGGILLGYENVKLPADIGLINNDSCYIHIDLQADFFVFKPEIGKEIQGVVNRKSKDHVGVLVYNAFNVSIPEPLNEEDWLGSSVNIGSVILFKITCIDFSSYLPYIRGEIVSILHEVDSLLHNGKENGEKIPKSAEKPNKKIVFTNGCELDETADYVVESPKKKHKNKKRKNQSFEETVEDHEMVKDISNLDVSNKRKKKNPDIEGEGSEIIKTEVTPLRKKEKRKHTISKSDISLEDFNLNELFNETKSLDQSNTEIAAKSDIFYSNDGLQIKPKKKTSLIELERRHKNGNEMTNNGQNTRLENMTEDHQSFEENVKEENLNRDINYFEINNKKKKKIRKSKYDIEGTGEIRTEVKPLKRKEKHKHKNKNTEISLEDLNLSRLFNESESSDKIKPEINIKYEINSNEELQIKPSKKKSSPRKLETKHTTRTDQKNMLEDMIEKQHSFEESMKEGKKKKTKKSISDVEDSDIIKSEVKPLKRKQKHKNSKTEISLEDFDLNELFNESKSLNQIKTERNIKPEINSYDDLKIKPNKKSSPCKLEKRHKNDNEMTNDQNTTLENNITTRKKHKIKREIKEEFS